MKTAILQVADTGPLESLVVMLQSVGYRCFLPSSSLKDELRRIGCDTVLNVADLVRTGSYEPPMELPEASLVRGVERGGHGDMDTADLYVDIKAHRCYDKVVDRWPNLVGKVLWYRINGGKPEHVIKRDGFDCGDEANPPCPVLTPNQWYSPLTCEINCWCKPEGKSYCCWPPFHRLKDYLGERTKHQYTQPLCLVHNLAGWGWGSMVESMRKLDVLMHGDGSPDGPLRHDLLRGKFHQTLAMVHLKSSDAPGYAIYEAMASGCPIVCSKRLIWRNRMQDLLIDGETCLTFDRETHDSLDDAAVEKCTSEIKEHLSWLSKPDNNRKIGEAGRRQLLSVVWSADKTEDVASLSAFMKRNFG